jgi:hypothetical protein
MPPCHENAVIHQIKRGYTSENVPCDENQSGTHADTNHWDELASARWVIKSVIFGFILLLVLGDRTFRDSLRSSTTYKASTEEAGNGEGGEYELFRGCF